MHLSEISQGHQLHILTPVQKKNPTKPVVFHMCACSVFFIVLFFVLACCRNVRRKYPANFICLGLFVSVLVDFDAVVVITEASTWLMYLLQDVSEEGQKVSSLFSLSSLTRHCPSATWQPQLPGETFLLIKRSTL